MAATKAQLDLPRVRLFRSGTYGEGTDQAETWTVRDLDSVVQNFWKFRHLYKPPVVVGHVEESPDGSHTAVPAVGVVSGLWREGRHLFGSFAEMNPEVRSSMDSGALLSVSVELYRDPSQADIEPEVRRGASGPMLRRAALLGGHPPRVKGLGSPPWAAGEGKYGNRPGWLAGETSMAATAEEAPATTPLDRDHLTAVAAKAGFSQTFLDSLDDSALAGLIAELHDRTLGGPPAADAQDQPDEPDVTQTPDDQIGDDQMPPREQMVNDLAAAGQDQATLEAMDDASLFEMWKQVKGAPAGAGAGANPAPAQMGERSGKTKGPGLQVIQLSPRALRSFAEAAGKAAVAATSKSRKQEDEAFLAEMVAQGKLTPAQADSKNGPMRKALESASGVARFGEGKSAREMLMDAIRGGPAVRTYGERLAVGQAGVAGGEEDPEGEVKGYLARKHGKKS